MSFIFYRQLNAMDCGPACLRMVARHYGRHYHAQRLSHYCGLGKEGVSLERLSDAAGKIGLLSKGVLLSYHQLQQVPLPAILHWSNNHYVVLLKVGNGRVKIADPASGIYYCAEGEVRDKWTVEGKDSGVALLLKASPDFYEQKGDTEFRLSLHYVATHLSTVRRQIGWICCLLLIGTLLQLVAPFLTQLMVDKGVNAGNLPYINLLLIAQVVLSFSNNVVSFVRNRLQLHVSNQVNMQLLSGFWRKNMRLPLSYFEAHGASDILQRINDNRQIQSFLTGQAISSFFSGIVFVIYAAILIFYNMQLFLLFVVGSCCYIAWIRLFLPAKRKINEMIFLLTARENNRTLQLVNGMQEIRLNNAQHYKQQEWEDIQAELIKAGFRGLRYNQWQSAGTIFLSELKNILISCLVARLVVQHTLTFGAMLAIQYVIGQLSGSIEQFTHLIQGFQAAKISMERLAEVHLLKEEEPDEQLFSKRLPIQCDIVLKSLCFRYPQDTEIAVLQDISFTVPEGKTVAIVGKSGSGKTTLLKILLKIWDNYEGSIAIGGQDFGEISPSFWRGQCGAVLQDGFLFNDTVARNICIDTADINWPHLEQCCKMANLLNFILQMPNGFDTMLGTNGVNISQGQKQRLLIARAIYRNPAFVFFDEATNALDATNEREIVDNLQEFFCNRTVVIAAHRLSTIVNADVIVVLDQGRIVESGTHDVLVKKHGAYRQLIQHQLGRLT